MVMVTGMSGPCNTSLKRALVFISASPVRTCERVGACTVVLQRGWWSQKGEIALADLDPSHVFSVESWLP